MPATSAATSVTDPTQARLGDLIELAVDQGLVEFCHVSRETVVVSLAGRPLTFTRPGARTFLSSLMLGWSRSEVDFTPMADAAESREKIAPPSLGDHPPPYATAVPDLKAMFSDGQARRSRAATPADEARPSPDEGYLDVVLSLAERLRLIDGYDKNRAKQRIRLKTPATTAEMSYFETLEYLTGSILEELRSQANVA